MSSLSFSNKPRPWFRDPAKNKEFSDVFQRPRPYHKMPDRVKQRLHHRDWSKMTTEDQIQDARLQFIMAESWMCHYCKGGNVYMEMRSLTRLLHSPIKWSGEFSEGKLSYFFARISNWTNKLPRTRDRAIQSMERLIKTCDKLLADLHDQERNEFYYTMGIKSVHDVDIKGPELYEKLFSEELKELERRPA